ncbi:MAG: gliding-associated putative transporter substrate-binding component GldG [Chthoniobacteraceae bacterium]|nr:gliding-associated putative transporter substrate-binding component GldG [Chthoniobacteraceae bacterium]
MKKGLETYLYSTVGVAAMFAILVAINIIGSRAKQRVDLTAEHAYTLSAGTRAILAKLDTPVQIRFYCTRKENRMPLDLKAYAQRVEDLLGEYRQASKGQIEIQKLDPEPDSDAEDSAKLDGVEGQMLPDGERVYLGVSVTMLDQKEALPFLTQDRERLLEYDLSRAISRVAAAEKPVVGIMSPLQLAGMPSNPMMARMGGGQGQKPWLIQSELGRDYTVKTVEMTVDKIPDEVKVLVLVHPKAISDTAQFAIDQFILRGGKLIAFLDPLAVLDRGAGGPMGPSSSSSIDKLLKSWGLAFDSTKVVADMNYLSKTRQGRAPALLTLTEKAVNKDDVLTANADNLLLAFPGAFTGTPSEGLKETVLLKSTTDSQLVEPMMAQMSGEEIIKSFKSSGTEYALAVRLTGKFKTAFPEGKPKAADPKPDGKPPEPASTDAVLKESEKENAVVLIGDSDFLQDQVVAQETMNPLGGQRMFIPVNGNLAFAQSAVDQLTGDENLIKVRSRTSRERPFTVVNKMQTDAEERYRSKIKELETGLADAQRKLSDLQRAKASDGGPGQRFILSPEQQQEIANFRKKETEVKQQLKLERKKLRADIDSLANRLKWENIAAVPFLVALGGVVMAVQRRRKQAAR